MCKLHFAGYKISQTTANSHGLRVGATLRGMGELTDYSPRSWHESVCAIVLNLRYARTRGSQMSPRPRRGINSTRHPGGFRGTNLRGQKQHLRVVGRDGRIWLTIQLAYKRSQQSIVKNCGIPTSRLENKTIHQRTIPALRALFPFRRRCENTLTTGVQTFATFVRKARQRRSSTQTCGGPTQTCGGPKCGALYI